MSPIIKKAIGNTWFQVLTATAVVLIIAGFLVPPMGIIDGSVLMAVGEIFAFAALWVFFVAIQKGLSAKVRHNNTSLTVGREEKGEEGET